MDYEQYDNFDLFGHVMDDMFNEVEDFAVMENMVLKQAITDQEIKLTEQELIIKQLKARVSALESAVLWCGEQCFDEMANNPDSKFKKIN